MKVRTKMQKDGNDQKVFGGNGGQEVVESRERLCPERSWHMKEEEIKSVFTGY